MSRADSPAVLDLIGNTPLVPVTRLDTGPCTLLLKLESQNPGGSIKDRIGRSMIEAAHAPRRRRDRGHRRQHRTRYLSKVYNDAWMMDEGLLAQRRYGDLRDLISRRAE